MEAMKSKAGVPAAAAVLALLLVAFGLLSIGVPDGAAAANASDGACGPNPCPPPAPPTGACGPNPCPPPAPPVGACGPNPCPPPAPPTGACGATACAPPAPAAGACGDKPCPAPAAAGACGGQACPPPVSASATAAAPAVSPGSSDPQDSPSSEPQATGDGPAGDALAGEASPESGDANARRAEVEDSVPAGLVVGALILLAAVGFGAFRIRGARARRP